MDITKLDPLFDETTEPKDEHLMVLLEKAYTGKMKCRKAVIPMELIKPFSDFKPELSQEYGDHFVALYQEGTPPALYVYEKDGAFIMSDDYTAYTMYTLIEAQTALCIVLGKTTIEENVTYGPYISLKLT
jgi:hypothetical protein